MKGRIAHRTMGGRARAGLALAVSATSALAVLISVTGVSSGASSSASASTPPCGTNAVLSVPNKDPDHVLPTLPASVVSDPSNDFSYNAAWPLPVAASPWKTFAGVKPPWKIGLVLFPEINPYIIDVVSEMKKEFAVAKKLGLVTGSLLTYVQPDISTATPAQQISAIQQMVREGVNGIMLMSLSEEPMAPAIDAAGKAGVPVVGIDDVFPNSKYAVNIWSDKIPIAFAKTAGLVNSGNVLIERGVAGNYLESLFYKGIQADLAYCPNLKVVGTVYDQWTDSVAKSVTESFLTSHPGLKINLVAAEGAASAGIIEAFQSLGLPVPPISEGGTQGGDISWWAAHTSEWKDVVGTANNGFDVAYTGIHVLFRILSGDGLKVNGIPVPSAIVTDANVAQYAPKNVSLTSNTEPLGPITIRCGTNTCLNQFFVKPGSPKGF